MYYVALPICYSICKQSSFSQTFEQTILGINNEVLIFWLDIYVEKVMLSQIVIICEDNSDNN